MIVGRGDNIGNERYDQIAFYGSLKSLRKGIAEREILADVTLLNNIDKVIDMLEHFDFSKVKKIKK